MANLVVGLPKGMASMPGDHFKEIKGRREIFLCQRKDSKK
jgi:hypothetical protein